MVLRKASRTAPRSECRLENFWDNQLRHVKMTIDSLRVGEVKPKFSVSMCTYMISNMPALQSLAQACPLHSQKSVPPLDKRRAIQIRALNNPHHAVMSCIYCLQASPSVLPPRQEFRHSVPWIALWRDLSQKSVFCRALSMCAHQIYAPYSQHSAP